jgi:hypothetical protein
LALRLFVLVFLPEVSHKLFPLAHTPSNTRKQATCAASGWQISQSAMVERIDKRETLLMMLTAPKMNKKNGEVVALRASGS